MLEVVVFVLVEDAVLPLLLLYLGNVGTDDQENIFKNFAVLQIFFCYKIFYGKLQ